MEKINFWKSLDDDFKDLLYTDSIYEIMKQQSQLLREMTKNRVFAIFDEIKSSGGMMTLAKTMSDSLSGISSIYQTSECIGDLDTDGLLDADDLYAEKKYGFEIYTEEYKFRLFSIIMKPIYPIMLQLDEGINYEIKNALKAKLIHLEKENEYKIENDEMFCDSLQDILQSKKVRYIIKKLITKDNEKLNRKELRYSKIIICEGNSDKLVLQSIAHKLNKEISIIVANSKQNIPRVANSDQMNIIGVKKLLVADSDGDEEGTIKAFREKIRGYENYNVAIINNKIEDWFVPEVANYNKIKFFQEIETLIKETDFEELCKKDKAFAQVVDFISQ